MDAADHVAQGDYAARVTERGPRDVRHLARAFNSMSERLQLNDEQRRRLLADISHELRTPLTVLQGNLEGMLDGIYQPDAARLESLVEETRVMSRLIDDLRTLADADSGTLKLQREPTDLGLLANEVIASFRGQAQSGGVSLSVEAAPDLPLIEIDPARIRQVLTNLIANALRYTDERRIDPRASVQLQDKAIEVTVSDTGRGIAAAGLAAHLRALHQVQRFARLGVGTGDCQRPGGSARRNRSRRRAQSIRAPRSPSHCPSNSFYLPQFLRDSFTITSQFCAILWLSKTNLTNSIPQRSDMYARKVVPILLIAGGVMMFMHHKRLELMGQGEEGEQHRPMGLRGPHSEWGKRVPPMFEMWHKRAHEQEQAAQQPAAARRLSTTKTSRRVNLPGGYVFSTRCARTNNTCGGLPHSRKLPRRTPDTNRRSSTRPVQAAHVLQTPAHARFQPFTRFTQAMILLVRNFSNLVTFSF